MAAKKGQGSIRFRADKLLWCGQISLGFDGSGKRVRKTIYGRTQQEVLEAMTRLQGDVLDGKPIQNDKVTVSQHFGDWLSSKKAVRSSTRLMYESHVNTHIIPAFGRIKLKDLDYRRINAFYSSLETKPSLSARTIYDIGAVLRMGLEDAVRKGIIAANPGKLAAKLPKGEKEARFLNHQELAAFLVAAKGERLEDGFILAVHTGLRPGEWLGLPWDAVDLDKGRLTVKQALHEEEGKVFIGEVKTKAGRRTISLPKEAIVALRRRHKHQLEERLAAGGVWSNEMNLVFTNLKGGPLRRTNIAKRDTKRILDKVALMAVADRHGLTLEEILRENRKPGSIKPGVEIKLPGGRIDTIKEADILDDITLHVFRHTHASLLIAAGVDIKTISRRLGHQNITITLQTYGHLLPGMDERAAEAMDSIMNSLPPTLARVAKS